jgi:glutamate racemase
VLKAIHTQLPHEALWYVADSAHAPYGDRTPGFIIERAVAVTEFLVDSGAKAVVVACNTATAMAADILRARFNIPIIALEPAIKPAAAHTRTGAVGVLATSRTLESDSVARLCHLYGGTAQIILQPCPGLVEQVERGAMHSEMTSQLLQAYIRPVLDAGVDTIVLGCTHYPFLEPQIRALVGQSVTLLDSADAVARQVQRKVAAAEPRPNGDDARLTFFTTGDPAQATHLISHLWGTQVEVLAIP